MFPKPLRREIIVLLGAKALVLAVIYLAFFSVDTRSQADGPAVQSHLLSGSAP
jgi:hypothetical protein